MTLVVARVARDNQVPSITRIARPRVSASAKRAVGNLTTRHMGRDVGVLLLESFIESLIYIGVSGRVLEDVRCGLMGFSFLAVLWSGWPLAGQATPCSARLGHEAIASLTHIAGDEHGRRLH